MKYLKIISPFIALWIFSYLMHITPRDAYYIVIPLIITGLYSIVILIMISMHELVKELT